MTLCFAVQVGRTIVFYEHFMIKNYLNINIFKIIFCLCFFLWEISSQSARQGGWHPQTHNFKISFLLKTFLLILKKKIHPYLQSIRPLICLLLERLAYCLVSFLISFLSFILSLNTFSPIVDISPKRLVDLIVNYWVAFHL